MELLCAGEEADLAFDCAAERPFILRPGVRREYSILAYYRYKGDGTIILKRESPAMHALFKNFRHLAKFFELTVESVASNSCVMLDVCFSRALGGVEYKLYQKTTSIWLPLSPRSSHTQSVHQFGPLAQIARISKTFSKMAEAGNAEIVGSHYPLNRVFAPDL